MGEQNDLTVIKRTTAISIKTARKICKICNKNSAKTESLSKNIQLKHLYLTLAEFHLLITNTLIDGMNIYNINSLFHFSHIWLVKKAPQCLLLCAVNITTAIQTCLDNNSRWKLQGEEYTICRFNNYRIGLLLPYPYFVVLIQRKGTEHNQALNVCLGKYYFTIVLSPMQWPLDD